MAGIGWKSVQVLSTPPTSSTTTLPLFPNLHNLKCEYTERAMPLLHMPLPSLTFLIIGIDSDLFSQNHSFPNFSPNLSALVVDVGSSDTFSLIEANYVYRWQNLCSVVCPQSAFDADALVHLSRMPALTELEFALNTTFPLAASHSPLVFSNLHNFTLHSKSLEPISQSLSQVRPPVITDFGAIIRTCPSRQELSSFFASVQTFNAGRTIERLRLHQKPIHFSDLPQTSLEYPELCLEDLRPCTSFNLRQLSLDIEWDIGLTDSDLLTLASAWPHLERLVINMKRGWNTRGGITLDGLL